ncbi:MAG: hypothetical protein QW837_06010 [Conexivisphaerales archaeon]
MDKKKRKDEKRRDMIKEDTVGVDLGDSMSVSTMLSPDGEVKETLN